jgi:ribonuclease E
MTNDVVAAEAPPAALEPVDESVAGYTQPLEDAWVELPAPSETPARAPRRRGRGRGSRSETVESAPEHTAAEDQATDFEAMVAKAAPVEPEVVAAPAAEPAEEPVAVGTAPIEPSPAPKPDPTEISAAAAAPRRGWWKRGG